MEKSTVAPLVGFSIVVKGGLEDVKREWAKYSSRPIRHVQATNHNEIVCIVDATYLDLQHWFNRDLGTEPPYPPGTLLHFSKLDRPHS